MQQIKRAPRKILIDLAQQIESNATERFSKKRENLKERLIKTMRDCFALSSDETLAKIAINILQNKKMGELELMAEVRELNTLIIPPEIQRPQFPMDDE